MEGSHFAPLGDSNGTLEGGLYGSNTYGPPTFHPLNFSTEIGHVTLGDSIPEARRFVPQPTDQGHGAEAIHQFAPGWDQPEAATPTAPASAYVTSPMDPNAHIQVGSMTNLAQEIAQFSIPVSSTIPNIYGTEILGERRDEIARSALIRFLEVEAEYKKLLTVEQRAGLYQTFLKIDQDRIDLWNRHIISSAQEMHQWMHYFRPHLELYLLETRFATQAVKGGKDNKPVAAVLWRSPIPCAPSKKSAEGPWIFKLVLAPDAQIDTSRTPTMLAKCTTSGYELRFAVDAGVSSGSASTKQVTPGVTCSGLDYNATTSTVSIKSLSFSASSNGRPFQVEFKLTVYLVGGKSHVCSLHSLPITTVSNVNQWKHGEGRYVAWYAFGEEKGPDDECTYASFMNALQFSHLTSTRQILGLPAMEKYAAAHKAGLLHFKSLKTKPGSDRSLQAAKDIQLYDSIVSFARVQRMLAIEEVQKVFIPKEKTVGRGAAAVRVQMMDYEEFSRAWNNWWGELAYRLYTGQLAGSEPRKLFLDGLVHVVAPNQKDYSSLIDPATHALGTTIIRTSSVPGDFTYTTVTMSPQGFPTLAHNRIEAPGGEYVTALFKELAITSLINVAGVVVDKAAIIAKYRAPVVVDKDGYVGQLWAQYASHYSDSMSETASQYSSNPSTPASYTSGYMDAASSVSMDE